MHLAERLQEIPRLLYPDPGVVLGPEYRDPSFLKKMSEHMGNPGSEYPMVMNFRGEVAGRFGREKTMADPYTSDGESPEDEKSSEDNDIEAQYIGIIPDFPPKALETRT